MLVPTAPAHAIEAFFFASDKPEKMEYVLRNLFVPSQKRTSNNEQDSIKFNDINNCVELLIGQMKMKPLEAHQKHKSNLGWQRYVIH